MQKLLSDHAVMKVNYLDYNFRVVNQGKKHRLYIPGQRRNRDKRLEGADELFSNFTQAMNYAIDLIHRHYYECEHERKVRREKVLNLGQ